MLRTHLCLRWSGRLHHLSFILKEVSAPSSIIHGEITPVMPLKYKTFPIYFTFAGDHQYRENAWISSIASHLPGGQGGGGEGDWGGKESGGQGEGRRGGGGGRVREWNGTKTQSLFWKLGASLLFFSHKVMSDSLQLHGLWCVRLPCPSLSPRVCSKSKALSWLCHPTISSSAAHFFFCLQPFPASGFFEWVNSSHQIAKVLELQLQHQSF